MSNGELTKAYSKIKFLELEVVQELGEHSDEKSMGIVEESVAEKDEDTTCFQEN